MRTTLWVLRFVGLGVAEERGSYGDGGILVRFTVVALWTLGGGRIGWEEEMEVPSLPSRRFA